MLLMMSVSIARNM